MFFEKKQGGKNNGEKNLRRIYNNLEHRVVRDVLPGQPRADFTDCRRNPS